MRRDIRRWLAEALGTFILVALGPGAVMVAASTHAFGHVGVALAFGLAVTISVASLGHVSGAHINPAVTIGLWSVRRVPGRDVPAYLIAQCAGAIAASALLTWIVGPVGNFGATVPAIPVAQAFVVEMGYSGLLAFVIMAVATDDRTPKGVAPFLIGATVFAGALVTGPLTGGSFNPARSLGPAVIGGVWTAHWLYWIAPVTGMIAGMWLYERLFTPDVVPATFRRMSRAFVNEDAGGWGDPSVRFNLPPRDDPGFDAAAAAALIEGAQLGATGSAEQATGYYWGEPKLRAHVELILAQAVHEGDDRLEQLARRFLG